MARCKECIHYAVCDKQRFMVQIDYYTFDEYNQVDGVEKYCYEYESPTTHVSPMAEVARKIFEEIESIGKVDNGVFLHNRELAELKKKYMGDQT